MPCYTTGSAEGDARLCYSEEVEKNALLTNMLCGICTRVEKGNFPSYLINYDPSLQAWWKEHQKKDAQEKAMVLADERRAKLATNARAKLTKAELEALGIR